MAIKMYTVNNIGENIYQQNLILLKVGYLKYFFLVGKRESVRVKEDKHDFRDNKLRTKCNCQIGLTKSYKKASFVYFRVIFIT